MAIMKTRDWQRLIALCKNEVKTTKGDKRVARGLLFRLTFYISENRLVKPQRRMKQEPPIQTVFELDKGLPLSPEEVSNALRLDNPSEQTSQEEIPEGGQAPQVDTYTTESSEPARTPRREEAREVSQQADSGGRNQIQVGEGGPEIPGISDG